MLLENVVVGYARNGLLRVKNYRTAVQPAGQKSIYGFHGYIYSRSQLCNVLFPSSRHFSAKMQHAALILLVSSFVSVTLLSNSELSLGLK